MALWRIKDMLWRQSSSSVFCQRDLKAKWAPRWAMVTGDSDYACREGKLVWLLLWISLLFLKELEPVILNQSQVPSISGQAVMSCRGRGSWHGEVRLLACPPTVWLLERHHSKPAGAKSKDGNRLSEILLHPGKSTLPSLMGCFKQAQALPANTLNTCFNLILKLDQPNFHFKELWIFCRRSCSLISIAPGTRNPQITRALQSHPSHSHSFHQDTFFFLSNHFMEVDVCFQCLRIFQRSNYLKACFLKLNTLLYQQAPWLNLFWEMPIHSSLFIPVYYEYDFPFMYTCVMYYPLSL